MIEYRVETAGILGKQPDERKQNFQEKGLERNAYRILKDSQEGCESMLAP
jgi:hypothetical protein